MLSADETQSALLGAWRLMLGKADGFRLLDLSADGFWNSFFAIVVARLSIDHVYHTEMPRTFIEHGKNAINSLAHVALGDELGRCSEFVGSHSRLTNRVRHRRTVTHADQKV